MTQPYEHQIRKWGRRASDADIGADYRRQLADLDTKYLDKFDECVALRALNAELAAALRDVIAAHDRGFDLPWGTARAALAKVGG